MATVTVRWPVAVRHGLPERDLDAAEDLIDQTFEELAAADEPPRHLPVTPLPSEDGGTIKALPGLLSGSEEVGLGGPRRRRWCI